MPRVLALAALTLFAVLAAASAAGRMGHAVGVFTSTGAQVRSGVQGLAAGDTRQAMHRARAALWHDPMDPPALALLGLADLEAGNRSRARQAMRLAGQLGWREPASGLYLFEEAMRAGDAGAAARRLDGMWRADPMRPIAPAMARRLVATPLGQAALQRRLALNPPWPDIYRREVAASAR